jgi:hypothetical protein
MDFRNDRSKTESRERKMASGAVFKSEYLDRAHVVFTGRFAVSVSVFRYLESKPKVKPL